MPDLVTIERPALDLDLTLGEVSKPPCKHAGTDAVQDFMLDPIPLASVGEGLDSGLCRQDRLELPGDRQWLRNWRNAVVFHSVDCGQISRFIQVSASGTNVRAAIHVNCPAGDSACVRRG